MARQLPYNPQDPKSIEAYALRLLDKSLKDILGDEVVSNINRGKGGLGQLLEKYYFEYEPNSKSEPDFPEAGLELKTTPIKKIGRGFVSKERLVLNIIDYNKEHGLSFRESSFFRKNERMLLLFYLYEINQPVTEHIFKIIKLWRFPPTDLKIIKDDWNKIVAKIKAGKAHEISEGDTFYLGACTKGENKNSARSQPFSSEKAKQRAYALKSKYLNYIIEIALAGTVIPIDEAAYNSIVDPPAIVEEPFEPYKRMKLSELDSIVKSVSDYENNQTFEDFVISKFVPFYGKSFTEIVTQLGLNLSEKDKSRFHVLSKAILGIQGKKKIEEFEKAGVEMKTIRLEASGALKESMSFAQINYGEIINEDWEGSYWCYTLTKRFFFVVFRKNSKGDYALAKVLFWTMPVSDLPLARSFWEDTKAKIAADNFDDFIKISDDRLCHVRPKAKKSADTIVAPSGRSVKKFCYWLNRSYIKKIIS